MSSTSVRKVLSKSFVDNHETVNEDTASELIITAELKIKEIEDERLGDEQFAAAKQVCKDISSAYSSAIKYEKAKIQFLLEKINEIRGGEVNPGSGANT